MYSVSLQDEQHGQNMGTSAMKAADTGRVREIAYLYRVLAVKLDEEGRKTNTRVNQYVERLYHPGDRFTGQEDSLYEVIALIVS